MARVLDRQGNTRVSRTEVESVGLSKSLWHKAELGDVEVAGSLAKLESGESNFDHGVCAATMS